MLKKNSVGSYRGTKTSNISINKSAHSVCPVILLAVLTATNISTAYAAKADLEANVKREHAPVVPIRSIIRNYVDIENDTINIKDYGAKCNDSADDTASINEALDVFRSRLTSTGSSRLVFPGGMCRISATLNFTGIRNRSAVIDGAGTTIDAQFSGGPVIDALYTRWLRVNDLSVITSHGFVPTTGYQMGLTNKHEVSDDNILRGVLINGNFSIAALYNRSSETSLFDHIYLWNSSATGYSLIQDGYNHFGVLSSFQKVDLPRDQPNSFNENLFISPDFRNSGGGPTVWLGFNSRHKYISGYIGSLGNYAVTLFGFGGAFNFNYLDFDMHIEGRSVTDEFLLTGDVKNPVINGLKLRDHSPSESGHIFKLDSKIESATLTNVDLQLGNIAGGVFDNPEKWRVSGRYELPAGSVSWNLPAASFHGLGTVGLDTRIFGIDALLGSISVVGSVSATSSLKSGVVAVAGLGTCDSSTEGTWWAVMDALAPKAGKPLRGGGTKHTAAYCDGSNWLSSF